MYWIYPIDTGFTNDDGGNYIFAKETSPNKWAPQYIGQTSNLKQRLEDHEKETCARRNSATHIHVHLNSTEIARLSEEKDLIDAWYPVCNG